MKKLFPFVLVVLGLGACDNTFDEIKKLATPPVLYFNSNIETLSLTDSFKISLKTAAQHGINQPYYSFSVTGDDKDSPLKKISFSATGTGGAFQLNRGSVQVANDLGTITAGQPVQLTFSTSIGGNYSLAFTGSNGFGSATTAMLSLFVFNNLLPVAKFTAARAGQQASPKYYQFDASASFDSDRNFGGAVKTYKYMITSNNYGTQTISTESPLTPLVFQGPGSFSVTLVVYDNDGAPSEPYTLPQPITIQ